MRVELLKKFEEDHGSTTSRRLYQKLLGSFLFPASRTRPAVLAAVSTHCRYALDPRQAHRTSLKSAFCYIKGAVDYELSLKRSGDAVLSKQCDANWASSRSEKRLR